MSHSPFVAGLSQAQRSALRAALAGLSFIGTTAAQWVITPAWESPAGGGSVAAIGDIDGDGVGDVAAGNGFNEILVKSGLSGAILYSNPGPFPGTSRVAAVGDVNGDGVSDFLSSHLPAGNGQQPGRLYLRSGINGTPIHSIIAATVGEALGAYIAGAEDTNGDGVPDFMAAAPWWLGGGGTPNVRIYSGATGSVLRTFSGITARALAGVGDVNGDGFADVAIGEPQNSRVLVYSGASGSQIHSLSPGASWWFGTSVTRVPDMNNDGRPEIAAAGTGSVASGTGHGRIRVHSGANAAILLDVQGAPTNVAEIGAAVVALGDIDRDGLPELAVHRRYPIDAILIISGSSGGTLGAVFSPPFTYDFGRTLASPGDLDGDGLPEVVIGGIGFGVGGYSSLWSIKAQAAISAQSLPFVGSTLPLLLSSPADAGRAYLLALSTGVSPGISLTNGRVIPLNPDPFFYLSLDPANPFLTNGAGVLGMTGTATASFWIPVVPGLAGTTLHAAFAVANPQAQLGVGSISPALAFTIL